jgi:hypothetical protein
MSAATLAISSSFALGNVEKGMAEGRSSAV